MAERIVVVTDQVFPHVEIETAILAEIGARVVVAPDDRAAMLEVAADADALLNTFAPLDAGAIAGLSRCRVIARYGIGVDNIDLDAARRAGIVVTNVPDYCVEEVAVHTLALVLAAHRRIPQADALARSGGWGVASLRPVRRLSELTVGLVGYGRIARRLATMLRAAGATVVAHDPFVAVTEGTAAVGLEELLRTADVVSLHCPLTPATAGLIGRDRLALMRSDALLVNTSRGGLVVLDDLLEALRDGRIGGAALDVFDVEPPDAAAFEGVPNLVVTPHVAFYSETAIAESQTKAAMEVRSVLRGEEPDYAVNTAR